MSEVDIEIFCDAERQHIKEGMVMMMMMMVMFT
jgi:hypothetical protein